MDHAAKAGIKPAEKTHRGNPIKRAKWHLGIRSQSKPQDIMNEVYRAMKALDFVSTGHVLGHVAKKGRFETYLPVGTFCRNSFFTNYFLQFWCGGKDYPKASAARL